MDHPSEDMQCCEQVGARCIALKYALSNLSHSMVQEVPPGVPGPFSVYLVFSLPKPDLSFLTRPRVCAPVKNKNSNVVTA